MRETREILSVTRLLGLAFAVSVFAATATAQVPSIGADGKPVMLPDDPAEAPMCSTPVTIRAHQDAVTLKKIDEALQRDGFDALKAHMGELEDITAHAPATLAKFDVCPGHMELHGATFEDYQRDVPAAAKAFKDGEKIAASWQPWPYPRAYFLIGSYFNEHEQWDKAWPPLERGLALAPTDPKLTSEGALTLVRLGRAQDSLDLCTRTLKDNTTLDGDTKARLMRCRGFALEELKRWDEAEAAYKESLVAAPGNSLAQNELAYIRDQKNGLPSKPAVFVDGKTGEPTKPH